jgi:hypothetical protein
VASAVPPRRRARAERTVERSNGSARPCRPRLSARQRRSRPTVRDACKQTAPPRCNCGGIARPSVHPHHAPPRVLPRARSPLIAAGDAREVGSTNGHSPLARSRRRTTTNAAPRPPTRGDRARPELRATREPASRCRAATTSGARLSPLR